MATIEELERRAEHCRSVLYRRSRRKWPTDRVVADTLTLIAELDLDAAEHALAVARRAASRRTTTEGFREE